MEPAPTHTPAFPGNLRDPHCGRVHLDSSVQSAADTPTGPPPDGDGSSTTSPARRSKWRKGTIRTTGTETPPSPGTSEAITGAETQQTGETQADVNASSSREGQTITTTFRVQRLNSDFEVSRGRPKMQQRTRPVSVEPPREPGIGADGVRLVARGAERRPTRGESILVFREQFSELIFSGHKTLEIRHMKLTSKEYWIGVGGVVLGRAFFEFQERIETRDRWAELQPEHRWDVSELPYHRTCAFRITDVVTLNNPVLYHRRPGAMGVCRFVPVDIANNNN